MAKRKGPIPIAWTTCPHCGERYDEGNAMAHFEHGHRACLTSRPKAAEPTREGER